MSIPRKAFLVTLATILVVALRVTPASAQWLLESKDQQSNIRIGFLAQPQLESLQTPDKMGRSTNLFLRRFRVLFGGKVTDKWTFFFETDSPNLGKANPDKAANPTGAKDAGTIYLQDAFVTYNYSNDVKIDTGLILLGLSHNHLQSAATLLPVDYGPYTFLESTPLGERVGRDYGIQLRGYPINQHVEYRVGVWQGMRGVEAVNTLRMTGRVVIYPVTTAPTGFFYEGTYQGSKQMVAIGAGFDVQKDYSMFGTDVFIEQPFNGGEQGFTFQADWNRMDGGLLAPSLAKQDAYLVEAGAHFGKGKLSPFLQYAGRSFDIKTTPNQNSLQVGLAYWLQGPYRNIKVSVGRLHVNGQPDRLQVLAQLQLFYF